MRGMSDQSGANKETTMEIGLLLFIISTLTFYLMYYFYQPRTSSQQQDQRKREGRQFKECLAGCGNPIKDSFSSLQLVSEAILLAGVSKARLVLGIDLTASNEW